VPLPPLVEPTADLGVDEVRRYSRHLIIPDVGMVGQKRLKNAKVLVRRRRRPRLAGADLPGGSGRRHARASSSSTSSTSPTCSARSSTARATSAGRRRSRRGTRRGDQPVRDVVLHEERLDSDNVLEIFAEYDLIVDGTDNFATRYLVNDAAVLLGKPYVWGSIYRFDGPGEVFWAEHGPTTATSTPSPRRPAWCRRAPRAACSACCARRSARSWHRGDQAHHRHRRAAAGPADDLRRPRDVLPHREAIRKDPAGQPITELIDYEAFCGDRVAGRRRRCGRGHRSTSRRWRCGWRSASAASATSCSSTSASQGVRDQPHPRGRAHPEGPVPLGDAVAELPRDRQVVFHCKGGVRSAEVLAVAKAGGLEDAVHVGGGVSAWVRQIEPEQPSY
jgi:sulfur-carrier protein adenylyltransferase/sulfurtransferase